MDKKITLDKYDKEINPILTHLLAGNIPTEKLPEIQNLVTNINNRYSLSGIGSPLYKIYYAQALIDYHNYNDDFAYDSLAYAKEIYGGVFSGYDQLYSSLVTTAHPRQVNKTKENISFMIIFLSAMSLGGWFLNLGDTSLNSSDKIGSFILPLILLSVGVLLYRSSRQ